MEGSDRPLEILLRYFDGCPGWETARDRIRAVLRELGRSTRRVRVHGVRSHAEAGRPWGDRANRKCDSGDLVAQTAIFESAPFVRTE
jgi:hypothetical protein